VCGRKWLRGNDLRGAEPAGGRSGLVVPVVMFHQPSAWRLEGHRKKGMSDGPGTCSSTLNRPKREYCAQVALGVLVRRGKVSCRGRKTPLHPEGETHGYKYQYLRLGSPLKSAPKSINKDLSNNYIRNFQAQRYSNQQKQSPVRLVTPDHPPYFCTDAG
jgi:hypothetical protein